MGLRDIQARAFPTSERQPDNRCAQCGNYLGPEDAFCSRCGAQHEQPAELEYRSPTEEKKASFSLPKISLTPLQIGVLVAVGFICLIIIVGTVYVIKNKSSRRAAASDKISAEKPAVEESGPFIVCRNGVKVKNVRDCPENQNQ